MRLAKEETVPPKKKPQEKPIPTDSEKLQGLIKDEFGVSRDVVTLSFATTHGRAVICYIDGLVDSDLLDRDIISRLKRADFSGNVLEAITASQIKSETDFSAAVTQVLEGNIAIFLEGIACAVIVDFKNHKQRSVETPDSEGVIRGPKEGFTETLRVNTSLLRRKLRTQKLIFEDAIAGEQTNTKIVIAYIDGIVNTDVLTEVRRRLDNIRTDSILESGYIEQFIEDSPFSPIATIGLTQKPDIAAARLLEGRVAIICDGTPHVLTVPQLFIENIQVSEDYYNRWIIASFLRLLRVLALFISITLPGFFVAMTTFNQEMIPTIFFTTLVKERQNVPFPTGVEVFILMLMFDLLKESGTRLPRAVGSAISIVGALIIGDAAVSAGIVGAPTVIIIALTAVAAFVVSSLNEFVTFYRYIFLILGSLMGIIGIVSGVIFILAQLSASSSFGVPILASFSPQEMKDDYIRAPLKSMKYRPSSISGINKRRRGRN